MRKIISFMHISLDGFVAGPNGEMNWIKVDEEIFDHVGKRISKGDTVPKYTTTRYLSGRIHHAKNGHITSGNPYMLYLRHPDLKI